jgi:hypothetical protein
MLNKYVEWTWYVARIKLQTLWSLLKTPGLDKNSSRIRWVNINFWRKALFSMKLHVLQHVTFWTRNFATGFVGWIFKNNVIGDSLYANTNIYKHNYYKQCVSLSQMKSHEDPEINAVLTARSTYAFSILNVMKCSEFSWVWNICITWLYVQIPLSTLPIFLLASFANTKTNFQLYKHSTGANNVFKRN